jgi:hypothetical protein
MRVAGWQERLNKMITEVRDKDFSWGSHDCFTFINLVHKEMTGDLLAPEWLGSYKNAYQAKKYYLSMLDKTGISNIVEAIDTKLERINAICPKRGSIVARRVSGFDVLGYSFGVMVSDRCAFLGADGLEIIPIKDTDLFWDIK